MSVEKSEIKGHFRDEKADNSWSQGGKENLGGVRRRHRSSGREDRTHSRY